MNAQPESWGELIRSIENERRNGGIANKVQPFDNIHRRKATDLGELDPVKMQYRKNEKEIDYLKKLSEQDQKRLEIDSNKINQKFNPISHTGPPRKAIPAKSSQNGRPNREWHLLSHVPEKDHQSISLFYDDSIVEKQVHNQPISVNNTAAQRRPFNILSNDYIHENDRIKSQEAAELKEHIKEVFWDTHKMDIIKGDYYDIHQDQAEKAIRQKNIERKIDHKISQNPSSYLSSEGSNYNIINLHDHTHKHPLIQPTNTMVMQDKTLHRIQQSKQHIEQYSKEANEVYHNKQQRSINRIKPIRWNNEITREYDILSNMKKEYIYMPPIALQRGALDHMLATVSTADDKKRNQLTQLLASSSSSSSYASTTPHSRGSINQSHMYESSPNTLNTQPSRNLNSTQRSTYNTTDLNKNTIANTVSVNKSQSNRNSNSSSSSSSNGPSNILTSINRLNMTTQ